MKKETSNIARPMSLRPTSSKNLLALGVSAIVASTAATAATTEEKKPTVLETVKVQARVIETNPYAQPRAPYKANESGDKRHVKPLAETPQTISVVTQTAIQESGRTDLKEILQAQPGITVGTGENGNAFGDRYIIRGYEARSDVFVDGLRDPGMTIRESFAVEQVEVSKGPSSTFAGRGAVGGAVNGITKQASTEYDFTKAQIGVGTDRYHRVTLDSNQKVNDDVAFRANVLHAYEEVPDREPADRERLGLALSSSIAVTDKLNIIADYYVLKAEDMPDLGTYIEPNGGDPVDDLFVYAQHQDFLKSRADTFTLRAEYQIDDGVSVENKMRYGTTDNGYVTTGARGNTRYVDRLGPNQTAHTANDPRVPTVSLSTHQGWQDVEYFVDQLNFFLDTDIGSTKHKFLFGAEYSEMNVLNGNYSVQNASNCDLVSTNANLFTAGACAGDVNGNEVPDLAYVMNRNITKAGFDSDYGVDTISLSAMDTMDITDKWSVFFGVRADHFSYSNTVVVQSVQKPYKYDDTLWNGHLGVVYNITDKGNVYLTYASGSEINGGESDLGANCGYGGLCVATDSAASGADFEQVKDSKPEDMTNIELGTKWNLFYDELLFTAAIFQMTKDDVMETVSQNSYIASGSLNTGKNRVKGIELSLVGNLTDTLSTQFGVTVMESEVLKAYTEAVEGDVLSNFAEKSLNWQLRYQATEKFSFGGTVNYRSEMYAGQPDTAATRNTTTGDYAYEIPSYTTLDLFAAYKFNEQVGLRLNVANVTDEDYYLAAYRSGSFTYIGDARSAKVTLDYEF